MKPLDQTVCRNLELASRREWLETNGIGGFASSTITGMNTRRYHGLLVAATKPPVGRMVLLSKLEETLIIDGRRVELSCNRYPGVVHPQGYLHLKEFRREPFPVFVYEAEGFVLEKSVFMVHGENSTVVQYELRMPKLAAKTTCALELRPLIAFRDYHGTTHENGGLNRSLEIEPGSVKVTPYQGVPTLHLAHSTADVKATGEWYRNFEYTIEQERGLDYREDLFNPFVLVFDLNRNPRPAVVASLDGRGVESAEAARSDEIQRRRGLLVTAPSKDPFVQELVEAADQFIVQRGEGSTVIAGYHWFADWGRDTMITLPGLTLATGRADVAKGILLEFAANVDRGMLPNRFPDAGESPEYNTVDATLWYFEAVRALAAYTDDYDFVRTRLYSVLADIIAWHERGTRYGIRVDGDGLLMAGEAWSAADLDGREGRRLGSDSAARQGSRDPGPLVQRAADHGGPGPQIRARFRLRPLQGTRRSRAGFVFRPVLERIHKLPLRCGRWRKTRRLHPPEPDFRRESPSQDAFPGEGQERRAGC